MTAGGDTDITIDEILSVLIARALRLANEIPGITVDDLPALLRAAAARLEAR